MKWKSQVSISRAGDTTPRGDADRESLGDIPAETAHIHGAKKESPRPFPAFQTPGRRRPGQMDPGYPHIYLEAAEHISAHQWQKLL